MFEVTFAAAIDPCLTPISAFKASLAGFGLVSVELRALAESVLLSNAAAAVKAAGLGRSRLPGRGDEPLGESFFEERLEGFRGFAKVAAVSEGDSLFAESDGAINREW